MVTDVLPGLVTLQSAESAHGTCAEVLGVVTCELDALNSGDSTEVTITVIPLVLAGGTTITNTARVSSALSDPDGRNNRASQDTMITTPVEADLSVTQSDSRDPVDVEDPLTYTITVVNHGPSDATGVVLTDVLPEHVTLQSAYTGDIQSGQTGDACTKVLRTVTCDLGALISGDSAAVTITVIPQVAAGDTTITNTANVTSALSDPDVSNNSASQTTFVNAIADLSLTHTASLDLAPAGGTLTYELNVTNNGPSNALDVVVTDTLHRQPSRRNPDHLSLVRPRRLHRDLGSHVRAGQYAKREPLYRHDHRFFRRYGDDNQHRSCDKRPERPHHKEQHYHGESRGRPFDHHGRV